MDMAAILRETTRAFCTEGATAPGVANALLQVQGAPARTPSGGLVAAPTYRPVFAHWTAYDIHAQRAGIEQCARVAYIVADPGADPQRGSTLTIGTRTMLIQQVSRTPYNETWIVGGA